MPTSHTKNVLFQSEHHPLVSRQSGNAEEIVLSLIHSKAYHRAAEAAAGLDVLDVGCNDGYGTEILASRARFVTGVDVSPAAIEAAVKLRTSSNAEFKLVDGDRLPFEDESFDLITGFQVIEHVVDVDRFLAEIGRVLRPSGRAIFTTPNAEIRLAPGMKPWNPFHVREYTADQLEETLSTVFSKVAVMGLMASPEIDAIERARVERAMRSTRLSRLVRSAIPSLLVPALRSLSRSLAGRNGASRAASADWSLEDLYYTGSPEERRRALDLIAECVKKGSPK